MLQGRCDPDLLHLPYNYRPLPSEEWQGQGLLHASSFSQTSAGTERAGIPVYLLESLPWCQFQIGYLFPVLKHYLHWRLPVLTHWVVCRFEVLQRRNRNSLVPYILHCTTHTEKILC